MANSKQLKKIIKVQKNNKQTTITLPSIFVELLDLNKGDLLQAEFIIGSGQIILFKQEVNNDE